MKYVPFVPALEVATPAMPLKGASSDNNKPLKTKRVIYKWTPQAHEAYIKVLKDAVDRGERTDTSFKPSVSARAIKVFRNKGLDILTTS